MITSKPMQLLLLFTIALIGACGLALLAVPFIGFGWHLFHGSFIASSGYRIPVPRDFYVSGDVQQPTMWKHGVGVPLFNRPFGMIGVRPRISGARFEFGNDLQNSSERMIAAARQEGLALRSVRTLSAGTGNAFCFEFVKLTEKKYGVTVRCAIDDTPLLMIYGGDEKFSPDFYAAVQGVSRTNSQPAQ